MIGDSYINETKVPYNFFDKNIFETVKINENLLLWIFVSILIGLGVILNLIVLVFLLSIKCNGTHYLLLQLLIVDLLSLIEVKWELFYISHRSWLDSIEWCPIYLGIDALTNTAQIFFIIGLNFHTISTYNLACKTLRKNEANLLYQEAKVLQSDTGDYLYDNELDGNGSVVTALEKQHVASQFHRSNHRRSIVIDYSRTKTKTKSHISVLLPIIFIWLLAMSISVPLFLFGRIIPTLSRNSNERICGVVVIDDSNNYLLQILLIKMRIVVPTLCLVLSTIFVTIKLWTAKRNTLKIPMINNVIDEDSMKILKLSLSLAIIFILCSMQRIYASLWFELISRPMMEYKYGSFNKFIGISGSILHYTSVIIRPLIYGCFDKNLKIDLRKLCCCICNIRK